MSAAQRQRLDEPTDDVDARISSVRLKSPVRRPQPALLGPADDALFVMTAALMVIGVLTVYSAGVTRALDDVPHYLIRQSAYAALSLLTMMVFSRVDYHRLAAWSKPALVASIGAMMALFLGLGVGKGEAIRWLNLGIIHPQPAEFAKPVLILWLSYSLDRKRGRLDDIAVGVVPHVLVVVVLSALCLLQPDFGSAVTMFAMTLLMMALAGVAPRRLAVTAGVSLPVAVGVVAYKAYRSKRVWEWLLYWFADGECARQIRQSLHSFQMGGWTGNGMGDGFRRLRYLAEAHTDFVLPAFADEHGFIGVCLLMGAFAFVVYRGLRAALRAPDDLGMYIGFGLTAFIAWQVLVNTAVTLYVLPTKGLALPLITFGGSNLVSQGITVGILLNISRHGAARAPCRTSPSQSVWGLRVLPVCRR